METIEQIFQVLAYVAVFGFLISGLDDLFFDSSFLVHLFRRRGQRPVTLRQLKAAPEQWLAVLVPAWQEGGIVNRMAEYASRVLLYERYDIFIGVYPNDPETIACLDRVCAENPRVHKVVVPHAGPTSKADCLNWIYRAVRLNEKPGVREYQLLALQDAEDILHPLLFKVYNYFVPRTYDMGQVPVFALERPAWWYWSANTYVDDFSELHTKDLFARETLGGVVPSAGVGTCFTRQCIEMLAAENHGDPFHTGNLTEDYEVGIRIKRAGFRTGVIQVPVERIIRRKRRDGRPGRPRSVTEVVAVREAFPATFWTAVRQRTRWILGISFQTWEQAGWKGSLAVRYTLVRDRRAPLTHLLNMAGYLTLAYVLFQWAFAQTPWVQHFYLRPVFEADSYLWKIVIIDTWLLAYRAAQKFISVVTVYNLRQATASIPRVVVGNMINFVATVRALSIYLAHKLFKRPIVWHKTAHVFPAEPELREYAKSIEDLLVEQGLVTREQIFQALQAQRGISAPRSLLRLGLLDEAHYTQVWARHSGWTVRDLDPNRVPLPLLAQFAEADSLRWEALPAAEDAGRVIVAFSEPPAPAVMDELRGRWGRPVEPVLARPSELAWTRDRVYPRLVLPLRATEVLAERLRVAARLEAAQVAEFLSIQRVSRRNLAEVFVDRGRLAEPDALRVWAECLGVAPWMGPMPALDQALWWQLGPAFWWLHRMLPTTGNVVLTCTLPHPALMRWLTVQTGRELDCRAVLPSRFDMAARQMQAGFDPEKALLEALVSKGYLRSQDLPGVAAAAQVVQETLPRWLLLQHKVSEADLHKVFLALSRLPRAGMSASAAPLSWAQVLPPGFAQQHRCVCLEVDGRGGVRLGLAQLPSAQILRSIYDRLEGYPLFFEAL